MKLTKRFLIDSIVSLENLIAEISEAPDSEFMKKIQGLERMEIPGLKVRLKDRTKTVEKYLNEK